MRGMRLFWAVIKQSGFKQLMYVYLGIVLTSALAVTLAEPGIHTYIDGVWFCWEVATTVGLGDFTCVTLVGRLVTVFMSLWSLVSVAALTGVVVDFINEMRKARMNQSYALLIDKLERLPELSPEELAEISERVRSYRP